MEMLVMNANEEVTTVQMSEQFKPLADWADNHPAEDLPQNLFNLFNKDFDNEILDVIEPQLDMTGTRNLCTVNGNLVAVWAEG